MIAKELLKEVDIVVKGHFYFVVVENIAISLIQYIMMEKMLIQQIII